MLPMPATYKKYSSADNNLEVLYAALIIVLLFYIYIFWWENGNIFLYMKE